MRRVRLALPLVVVHVARVGRLDAVQVLRLALLVACVALGCLSCPVLVICLVSCVPASHIITARHTVECLAFCGVRSALPVSLFCRIIGMSSALRASRHAGDTVQ